MKKKSRYTGFRYGAPPPIQYQKKMEREGMTTGQAAPVRTVEAGALDIQPDAAMEVVAQPTAMVGAAGTIVESAETAIFADDPLLAAEGADGVHAAAPAHRMTTAEVAALPEVSFPRRAPENDGVLRSFRPGQDMPRQAAVITARDDQPRDPAVLQQDEEHTRHEAIVEMIVKALDVPEQEKFTTFCRASNLNPFYAILGMLKQALYAPEALHRTKQQLFSGGMKVSVFAQATPQQEGPRSRCDYEYCTVPFTPTRAGQRYHPGCGLRAAGKLTEAERQQEEVWAEEQRAQALQRALASERRGAASAPREAPVAAQPQPLPPLPPSLPWAKDAASNGQNVPFVMPPPAHVPGECDYCHKAIPSAKEGQRYHVDYCGLLASGKNVLGKESLPAFIDHQTFEHRRKLAAMMSPDSPALQEARG